MRSKNVVITAKVIGDGKITIPKADREYLNIKIGDMIRVQILEVIKSDKKMKDD
ncbi:hypothetical protein TBCH5v1_2599 [Thermococcus barophilus]|uniref:SpoVT-AbrB domain-containing protein n=1 Tax=Thermococcus barophilus TaxID=55802 RepID=A0A0S1XFI7_THEBA|nr:hypothetical protein TBCH5v1_2599 [Thermococcus barophilus]